MKFSVSVDKVHSCSVLAGAILKFICGEKQLK